MAFLCISLNNSSVNAVHILDGELKEIDKYTVNHSNAKSILKEFPEKIQELRNRYNLEKTDSNIRVRIFLNNDKEQFVMYKKHIVVFKSLLKNIEFLKYAVTYDSTLFSKYEREVISNDDSKIEDIISCIKKYLLNIDEDEYYQIVRKLCNQYINYIEDSEEENYPTIDEIYMNYIEKAKTASAVPEQTIEIKKDKEPNPFAVFEHPNFFKTYGKALNKQKPIFILGGKLTQESKTEYKELIENTRKCFSNPIYNPFNANVSASFDNDMINIYLNSLLVIVNGNEYNENLASKIELASNMNITILILVNDDNMKEVFSNKFGLKETIIIKSYLYDSYKSKKEFSDIMVGLYINEYKKIKVAQ